VGLDGYGGHHGATTPASFFFLNIFYIFICNN
jgi:hypothetical protein